MSIADMPGITIERVLSEAAEVRSPCCEDDYYMVVRFRGKCIGSTGTMEKAEKLARKYYDKWWQKINIKGEKGLRP